MPSLAKLTAKHYPTDAPSAKQEAKMNWVKCTDMRKQPIFVNIENATTIFWNEAEKVSIVAFASSGGDNVKVLEKPESVIRGQ
jgi:biopolymer transport protein ExbD